MKAMKERLAKIVESIADITSRPAIFAFAILIVTCWFIAGTFLRYNETWFTILDIFVFLTTFFLVFVVQSTQNADTKAMQDKLDEIIDSLPKASNKKKGEEKALKRGKKTV